jgi:hypothetical protein
MIRRAILAAIALGVLAEQAAAQAPPAGQYVDLAPVAMPIVADGRLINYVFVDVRINLTPQADMPRWRDKEPYFRDALVKLGYRTPFTRNDDYTKLDEARLKVALYQAAAAIAGPDQIAGIQILPGGGPMRRAGLPKPKLATR